MLIQLFLLIPFEVFSCHCDIRWYLIFKKLQCKWKRYSFHLVIKMLFILCLKLFTVMKVSVVTFVQYLIEDTKKTWLVFVIMLSLINQYMTNFHLKQNILPCYPLNYMLE